MDNCRKASPSTTRKSSEPYNTRFPAAEDSMSVANRRSRGSIALCVHDPPNRSLLITRRLSLKEFPRALVPLERTEPGLIQRTDFLGSVTRAPESFRALKTARPASVILFAASNSAIVRTFNCAPLAARRVPARTVWSNGPHPRASQRRQSIRNREPRRPIPPP